MSDVIEKEFATYDTVTNQVWPDEDGNLNSYLLYRAPEQIMRVWRDKDNLAWHPVGVEASNA